MSETPIPRPDEDEAPARAEDGAHVAPPPRDEAPENEGAGAPVATPAENTAEDAPQDDDDA